MRPTATQPAELREPFNQLLATETNVRVLRILAKAERALGRSEVARRAELNDSGVRRALDRLIKAGIVESVAGGVQAVRLRRDHRLVQPLIGLYEGERTVYEDLVADLREAVAAVDPPVASAWVEGMESYELAGARGLELGVVVGADEASAVTAQLSEAVREVAARTDVRISAHVLTRADLLTGLGPAEEDEDVLLLVAPHPAAIVGEGDGELRRPNEPGGVTGAESEPPANGSHAEHDRRQRRAARVLAEWILYDPGLIDRAMRNLEARLPADAVSHDPRAEWLAILKTESAASIRKLLLDESDTGQRLRQSMPFPAVLSPDERETLLRRLDDDAS